MKIGIETKQRASRRLEQLNLSVLFAAKKIGTSQSTLWNFLYGETKNFGKLAELAGVLKVSLHWLLTGDGSAEDIGGVSNKFTNTETANLIASMTIKHALRGAKLPNDRIAAIKDGLKEMIFGDIQSGQILSEEQYIRVAAGMINASKSVGK